MEVFGRTMLLRSTFSSLATRRFSSASVGTEHHKVVVVGGGSAGASLSTRLSSFLHGSDLAIIEPSENHYYQPLWTLVGAGIRPYHESVIPMTKVLPKNAHWIKDSVSAIDPEASKLHLKSGKQITYEHLILALGMQLRYDLIPGAISALKTDPRVCSNYAPPYCVKTFKAYQAFEGGRAIFTLPVGPIKCAGAPQKVMYLFEDYIRKKGRRQSADIHYFTALGKIFSVDKYAEALAAICRERDIHYHLQHHLIDVDSAESRVTVEDLQTKATKTLQYDLLHITPPMSVPQLLKDTPNLTDPKCSDYVDVNAATLRHNRFSNIWALGDCSSLPTSKTAAAISSQGYVLCANLKSVLSGGPDDVKKYDGYTACPILTGYDRAILAEFDYNLQPLETLPIDQGKERYINYFLKVHVMPPLYRDWMLKGLWAGPKTIRKLLHLGFSK